MPHGWTSFSFSLNGVSFDFKRHLVPCHYTTVFKPGFFLRSDPPWEGGRVPPASLGPAEKKIGVLFLGEFFPLFLGSTGTPHHQGLKRPDLDGSLSTRIFCLPRGLFSIPGPAIPRAKIPGGGSNHPPVHLGLHLRLSLPVSSDPQGPIEASSSFSPLPSHCEPTASVPFFAF